MTALSMSAHPADRLCLPSGDRVEVVVLVLLAVAIGGTALVMLARALGGLL